MAMHKTWNVQELADVLYHAEASGIGAMPLTDFVQDLTDTDAYNVQLINIQRKLKLGQKIVGKKIGLTSIAMQRMLNVDQPDYGHLLNGMEILNGGVISLHKVMQPKVEGEIAFILKHDLSGPSVTVNDVLAATKYVCASLEIVDSRVAEWQIKLQDTIADNASSGLFALGDITVPPDQVDLVGVNMILYKNGIECNRGNGAASLGNPAYGVAWLANKLFEFGITLRAGEIVLSGALSAAVDAMPGDSFLAQIDRLGEVRVSFANIK